MLVLKKREPASWFVKVDKLITDYQSHQFDGFDECRFCIQARSCPSHTNVPQNPPSLFASSCSISLLAKLAPANSFLLLRFHLLGPSKATCLGIAFTIFVNVFCFSSVWAGPMLLNLTTSTFLLLLHISLLLFTPSKLRILRRLLCSRTLQFLRFLWATRFPGSKYLQVGQDRRKLNDSNSLPGIGQLFCQACIRISSLRLILVATTIRLPILPTPFDRPRCLPRHSCTVCLPSQMPILLLLQP